MKNKVIVFLFVVMIFGGLTLTFLMKDREISTLERRKLANMDSLKEDFIENLDEYLSDQFILRDNLLAVGAVFNRNIIMNKESNDVYLQEGYIIEKDYPLDDKNVERFIGKINRFASKYSDNSRIYYSLIPDKSYYLDGKETLKIDFDEMISKVRRGLNYEYIDVMNSFKIDDYYKTDIHLKQNAYFKVIDKFLESFGFEKQNVDYKEYILDDFYGASFSKVPYVKPDKLSYYSNEHIENASVKHLEYGIRPVYDLDTNTKVDLYNVFLSGPSSFIEIENNKSSNDRELVVFRDSFGSSFVPLLIPYYKKITLVDLRYIKSELLDDMISSEEKDILFLYSTMIVNNSNLLK